MQKIILLFVFLVILTGCKKSFRIVGRKTLRVPASENIVESKKRGAFLWEYEPCTYCLFDSIYIRVLEAFVENECWYANQFSDSIKVNHRAQRIIIQYEDNPWPGYYGDTLTYTTSKSFINWFVGSYSDYRHRSFYHLESGVPVAAPDTLYLPIEVIEQHRDSIYDTHYPKCHAVIRKDTIGFLQLIRKRN